MMETTFTAEFFVGNRQRLRELFTGKAPIVITANGLLQKSSDEAFPFKQDSNFWYLTGIDRPDLFLIIDKDKEYLIVPERSDSQDAFDGAYEPEQLTRQSGITTILNAKEGWKQLSARLKKVKHIATLGALPSFVETHGFYANPARQHLVKRLKAENSEVELLDLRPHMGRLRMIKQPQELVAIQAAIDLTIDTIKHVARKLPKLAYEYEIEAEITGNILKHGSTDTWKPIVAAGKNACVIHAQIQTSPLSADELVIMDIGAVVQHYDSDISRTLAIGGKPSRRQQLVHEAVIEVQNYAFSLLGPGVVIREYEKLVEQFMGEKLRELGLIKTIERETVRKFFPHATSHFLGLDAHDAGDYERPLEPGVVLAVEPGIYIPEEAIGVRIEDNVLITPNGITVLSERLSRELT